MHSIIIAASEQLKQLELFVSITSHALHLATKRKEQLDLVRRIDEALGESREQTPDAVEHGERVEQFAKDQTARGNPYLFDLASVRLWGLLEACVDDLVAKALLDPTKCKDHELLNRLKGPLLPFRAASPAEQAEYLADTLRNSVDAPLKLGIGRFEAILEPIGLSGAVHDTVRKLLLELSQVRNLVVHRAGRVDKRFLEVCPWRGKKNGEPITTDSKSFWLYHLASYWYLANLRGRLDSRDGGKNEQISEVLAELEEALQKSLEARESNAHPEATRT
jgi:hypothetical protein